MERKIVYFEKPGKENTDAVMAIVKQRAAELGIKTIVVASYQGYTALRAVDTLQGLKVVVIAGRRDPTKENIADGIPEKDKKYIEGKGGIVYVSTHLFSGLSGAMRKKFNTCIIGDVMASTLRIFGSGIKVCVEMAAMAADAGLVRTDEDTICVAGSRSGADAAAVIRPATSSNIFDMKVQEILCKPLL
ncbi:MAG: pyruvate kinase alpha/beta domain-containing protein [Chloroflexota bacterium]